MRTNLLEKYQRYEKEGKLKFHYKSMFIPRKDHLFIAVDLKQAESWIVAYSADEPNMKESLLHGDIHLDTAANALYKVDRTTVTKQMRYAGKQNNHANSYGMSDFRRMQVFNQNSDKWPYMVVTLQQSKEFGKAWHDYYFRIRQNWWPQVQEDLQDRITINPYGRWRQYFERYGDELFKQAYANHPQSTISDHFKGAIHPELNIKGGLLEVYNKFMKNNGPLRLVNEAHDSFLGEAPSSQAKDILLECIKLIQRPLVINNETFTIPCDAEIGDRWGELEEFKI